MTEILITKTDTLKKSVDDCKNNCLTLLANMAKVINYNAVGVNTICTFTEIYNGFKFSFTQYQKAQKQLRIKKEFNKRFTNKRYLKVK